MTLDEKILATLEEIRDAQKELLSIHRANAAALKQSHELQTELMPRANKALGVG